jgi:hypothetical protein
MKGHALSGIALAAVLIICSNSEARAQSVMLGNGGGWFSNKGTPRASFNNSGKTEAQRAMVAAANPANQKIATKVFCYCGCDREDGHKNLLDCYNTGHVPHCPTCQQEFNRIQTMNTQPISEIQNRIDGEFAIRYPYHEKSDILKQYLSTKGQPYM